MRTIISYFAFGVLGVLTIPYFTKFDEGSYGYFVIVLIFCASAGIGATLGIIADTLVKIEQRLKG